MFTSKAFFSNPLGNGQEVKANMVATDVICRANILESIKLHNDGFESSDKILIEDT